jgi:multicomponent Na+:H+ antiporter subunit C
VNVVYANGTAALGSLIIAGLLFAIGVYLLLERSITKMLLGVLLASNAVNLLILTVGGPSGNPPVIGRETTEHSAMADPLVQAVILTAIVITMGIAAFVLALAYRSFTIHTADDVEDDSEDTKVQVRTRAEAPDFDRSDDPLTGDPTPAGDAFGPPVEPDSDFDPEERIEVRRQRLLDTAEADRKRREDTKEGGPR